MSTNSEGFLVILESFAKSHYCKDFEKRPSWQITWQGLEQTLTRFDADALAGKLEPPIKISEDRTLVLYKMNFRLADENKSPKASGNRVILVVNYATLVVRVLLVYHKRHVKGSKETAWWTGLVYDEYSGLP
jgi:hypothetical protein